MWLWGLVAGIILTALFLVITLAQVEAGAKGKPKWLGLTFCSLALVVGLVVVKPNVNMGQVNYQPAPSLPEENLSKDTNPVSKNSASKSTSSSAANKAQSTSGQEKEKTDTIQKEAAGKKQEEPTLQDQLNLSLQKKGNTDENIEYSDPVLKEIMDLKRQAEENREDAESEETEQFNDAGFYSQTGESQDFAGQEPTGQLQTEPSDSEPQNSSEKQEQKQQPEQQVVKARVLVSSLNVREKFSVDSRIITTLKSGDTVEVINETEADKWVKVKLNAEQTGWVMRDYIKIQS